MRKHFPNVAEGAGRSVPRDMMPIDAHDGLGVHGACCPHLCPRGLRTQLLLCQG